MDIIYVEFNTDGWDAIADAIASKKSFRLTNDGLTGKLKISVAQGMWTPPLKSVR